MQPLLTIVLPTFNESKNIDLLLLRIKNTLTNSDIHNYEILFIDDSSDETPFIIRAAAEKNNKIKLIHRLQKDRTGLATAFVKGFENAQGEYICCIDSDLQHPPEVIPSLMMSLINNNADISIASRYIPGGSAEGLRTIFRKFISKLTKIISHIILEPSRKSSDPGSGFFIFKQSVIENITLSPQGFKILLEILVRGSYNKIVEFPYTFHLREQDDSKATLRQGIKFIKHLLHLFYTVPSAGRFLRFAMVGASGVIVNLATVFIFKNFFNTSVYAAWAMGVLISIISNFLINNYFTFSDQKITRKNTKLFSKKLLQFTLISAATSSVNFVIFSICLALNMHYIIAALLGIIAGLSINYTISKKIIWSNIKPSILFQIFIKKLLGINLNHITLFFMAVFILIIGLPYLFSLQPLVAFIFLTSLFLATQGLFSLYVMVYTWEDPDRVNSSKSPKIFSQPLLSFTALVPARHEQEVIAKTIETVNGIDYPNHLKEIIVICRSDDIETIEIAQKKIHEINNDNVKLLIFDGYPINKPHGLNLGLEKANGNIITIFDAEDEPHRDIYNIVNTVFETKDADVVQSGVQLMNYRSNWYSLFNVLEYFFWFKSSLHFFSHIGLTPLGGNTVFFKKTWLNSVDGWDENCLTEDADVGIRLSLKGAKIKVVYDESHVTQEETPPTLSSFIKQRTRWNQGFIQILFKGEWKKLPTIKQKLLALYILAWPIIQGILFIYIPISFWIAFTAKIPTVVALLANFPLFILALFLLVYNIGLVEFTKDYNKQYKWHYPFLTIIFFYPFQLILGFSAFRAVFRLLKGTTTWEKTEHTNAHRLV